MNKQEAFDTVVAEFATTMRIVRKRGRTYFTAAAPNGAEYSVSLSVKDKDHRTGGYKLLRVVVWQGPVLIHSGSWFPSATTAAKAAVAAVRNTGYMVQGELL